MADKPETSTPDKQSSTERLVAALTSEERKLLLDALSQVHDDVVARALNEIRIYGIALAGVLTAVGTIFGLISWSGLRSDIVDVASNRYANDAAVKQQLIDSASRQLPDIESLQKKANGISNFIAKTESQLNSDAAVLSNAVATEMRVIREMLEQIRGDVRGAVGNVSERETR